MYVEFIINSLFILAYSYPIRIDLKVSTTSKTKFQTLISWIL